MNIKSVNIYSNPKHPSTVDAYGNFGIFLNGTDHFAFYCRQCNTLAEIIRIYAVLPNVVCFILQCPKCGHGSSKKIYMDNINNRFLQARLQAELKQEVI